MNDGAAFASYRLLMDEGGPMKIDTTMRRRAAVFAIAALALVATVGVAVTGDASALNAAATRSDATPVRSWPYDTGGLPGTSETYVDMWEDGSYYDPSLGRRVSPSPLWSYDTGALAGTSETYVDMWEDGSYYDPSLGRRVSPAR
jgi:hypothetical protein